MYTILLKYINNCINNISVIVYSNFYEFYIIALKMTQLGRNTSSLSSSSSYICHRVGPLVELFRSHVSVSLFKGLT
jgi:hypothetical protein